MSAITELNPRLLGLTEAGVSTWLDQTRRATVEGGGHGPAAERVEAEGDPAKAIRALTDRITALIQES